MKIKYWIISIPLFFVAVLFVVSLKDFVSAQAVGQSIEVSPPSQELSVDPGKRVVVTAKVRNPGSKTLPIEVRLEDFTAKGNEGQVELSANSSYSIVSWAKVTPTTFTLEPGEQREVTATITVPSTAAGGHYGSFVFKVVPPATSGGAAAVSQEIASLFLVKVSGPVDERLELTKVSAPMYSEFGPIPFALTFQNVGNIHVKTFGLINVKDMFGNKVDDIVVSGTNVFPGADRVLTASLNKPFLIGKYTATALMYYGSQNQSIMGETSFIVFPTRIAIVVVVILFILYLLRKRLKKAMKALFK